MIAKTQMLKNINIAFKKVQIKISIAFKVPAVRFVNFH